MLMIKVQEKYSKSYAECISYIIKNSMTITEKDNFADILCTIFRKAPYYYIMFDVIETVNKIEDLNIILYKECKHNPNIPISYLFTRSCTPILDYLEKLNIKIIFDTNYLSLCLETLSENLIVSYFKYIQNINDITCNGVSLLLLAVKSKKMLIFDELIKLGASIRVTDNLNRSILHYSCIHGNLEMVKKVIDIYEQNKIDLDQESHDGWTALHYSCLYKKGDIIEYLLKNSLNFQKPVTKYNDREVTYYVFNLIELNENISVEEKEYYVSLFIEMMY